MNPERKTTILCIDDDSDDQEMLQDAFYSIDSSLEMLQALNGEKGLHQLLQMKQTGCLPCLIVLDVNMPGLNGLETLEKIKADKALSAISVVIFSTSTNAADKTHFTGKSVEYITKPFYYDHFVEIARRMLSHCAK